MRLQECQTRWSDLPVSLCSLAVLEKVARALLPLQLVHLPAGDHACAAPLGTTGIVCEHLSGRCLRPEQPQLDDLADSMVQLVQVYFRRGFRAASRRRESGLAGGKIRDHEQPCVSMTCPAGHPTDRRCNAAWQRGTCLAGDRSRWGTSLACPWSILSERPLTRAAVGRR